MALEAGSYISDLVSTNPTGTDPRNQGDDHVRLIKSVLKTTFPNLDGPVTSTPAEMNLLAGQTSLVPAGAILAWAGAISAIPTGWQLCNGTGTTGTGIPVPNLLDRFIIHADADSAGTHNPGNTGGTNTPLSGLASGAHTLTTAEIPAHRHLVAFRIDTTNAVTSGLTSSNKIGSRGLGPGGDSNDRYSLAGQSTDPNSGLTSSVGSSSSHSHSLTGTTATVRPKYYALAYIIKL